MSLDPITLSMPSCISDLMCGGRGRTVGYVIADCIMREGRRERTLEVEEYRHVCKYLYYRVEQNKGS